MKLWKFLLLPVTGLLALTGCSGTDLLNLTIPRSGYSVHSDIAYGGDDRQKLDVYVPDQPAAGHPVALFFYGGSWQTGSRKDYLFVGQALASRGVTVVIADYRLYPQVYFPAFMEDAGAAFVWTHAHIHEYGGNPANLFVTGHSAGGYIAVMLTVNDRYIRAAGGDPGWIKGTVGIAGPYDFLPFTDPKIKALFSKVDDAATQPIHYVKSGGLPPMLLVAGDKDTQVLPRNTEHLSAKLRSFGDPVEVHYYPGVAHVGIVLALANGFHFKASVLDDMTSFIARHTAADGK